MTKDENVHIFQSFYFTNTAGEPGDPTAWTLTWLILFMILHPEIQEECYQAIKKVSELTLCAPWYIDYTPHAYFVGNWRQLAKAKRSDPITNNRSLDHGNIALTSSSAHGIRVRVNF